MSKKERGPAGGSIFGLGVRALREAHAMDERELVLLLSGQGYNLAIEEYQAVENGVVLPAHAAGFLGAFEASLGLSGAERRDLEDRLSHDIIRARLGDRAKESLLPHPGWSE